MTLKEMLEEVEIFGSGDVIDDRDLIISLANRALREIHCLLPLTKSLTINLRGQSPTVYYGEIKSPKAGKIILPLSGKAYSFRICFANCGTFVVVSSPSIMAYTRLNNLR